jgi:hypothetical protein
MALPDEDDALDREPSMTINEFLAVERMSRSSYYKMRALGYGPAEMRVPGTEIIRISARARREWHARLEERNRSEAAELEHERRASQRRAAGKNAAASPRHISRRPIAAPARATERRR